MVHTGEAHAPSKRSKSTCSRGNSSPVASQVWASAPARSASSAAMSAARSRSRPGSSSTTKASEPNRSVMISSVSISHGSHDSIPSEELALGQPLPLFSTPGAGGHQPLRRGPHRRHRPHFPSGEDHRFIQRVGGPLVGHRELGEAVHLVAPQVDPHRAVGGGREHVHDGAPHREHPPVLHLHVAPVAPGGQIGHQSVEVNAVAPTPPPPARRRRNRTLGAGAGPEPGPPAPAGTATDREAAKWPGSAAPSFPHRG